MSLSRDTKWLIGILLTASVVLISFGAAYAQIGKNTEDIARLIKSSDENSREHKDIMRSLGRIEGILEDRHE